MNVSRLKATVKVLPIFECHYCKTTQNGSTMTMEFDEDSLEGFILNLSKRKVSSHYMPIGWNFTTSNKFQCQGCRK